MTDVLTQFLTSLSPRNRSFAKSLPIGQQEDLAHAWNLHKSIKGQGVPPLSGRIKVGDPATEANALIGGMRGTRAVSR
ncbi:hypothetical protein [Streptomyces cadmiisoli]|uniref:hypothetical protein n=1 Tax=Streptomyces cadmiisoli TaxID=2184053 RepID=UPI003D7416A3